MSAARDERRRRAVAWAWRMRAAFRRMRAVAAEWQESHRNMLLRAEAAEDSARWLRDDRLRQVGAEDRPNWKARAEAAEAARARQAAECEETLRDLGEERVLREKLAGILTATASALKGPPPPLTSWDWSDLPEVAAGVRAAAKAGADRIPASGSVCQVWAWGDAPEAYRKLSGHGGDEDLVVFLPGSLMTGPEDKPYWTERIHFATPSKHEVEGGWVLIYAHA